MTSETINSHNQDRKPDHVTRKIHVQKTEFESREYEVIFPRNNIITLKS